MTGSRDQTSAGAKRSFIPSALNKRYGYHVARRLARVTRGLYGGPLAGRLDRPIEQIPDVEVHLVSFSGERDALEQAVSYRSFLRHVGRPSRVTLGSDGSHSRASLDRLSRIHDNLEIVGPDAYLGGDLPPALNAYASDHGMGKKLAFSMSLRSDLPILYADSDVLFFPGAGVIRGFLDGMDTTPRYLLDCMDSLDERVLPSDLAEAPPVNAGFWLVGRPLDWEEPLELLEALGSGFEFHTEQTLFHVAMHRAGGTPLDPARFVMRVDDRFRYRTIHEAPNIALRHYVSNIRHQFWLHAGA